jgi:Ca-activated chloride channel family protein
MDCRINEDSAARFGLPLTGVDVTTSVIGRTAKVICRLQFYNPYDHPLECIYSFPLPEGSACCGFSVTCDGRVLEGAIEEAREARSKYERTIGDGDGVYLLDQETPNIFKLFLGNLLPHSTHAVEIAYVERLQGNPEGTRFSLPTTISPRYIPARMPAEEKHRVWPHSPPMR